jgi:RNA polymerase subunit RPABC4/transcription elongation factor Spt4
MALGTAKMFGCPVCGFRVSTGDNACPRCGQEFGNSTKFECPFCGELVQPGVKTCPSCHVNYIDFKERTEARGGDDSIDNLLMEIIKLESQAVKSEEKRLSCPICSWLLDGNETACPKCGKSFVEDVTFQCPVCGSLVNADAERCSECGSAFEEEAGGRAAMHAQASTALDEIMSAASHETDVAMERQRPEPEQERPSQMKNKVTSIFGKIADVVREEPKAKPEPEVVRPPQPAPEPEPEPAPEPIPETVPEKKPEPAPEPETTAEEEPKPAEAEQPKKAPQKSRQRKLKTKTKG